MSTVLEKLSDEMSVSEMKRRRPSGKHPYKPHLSTKIKWALEDAMERTGAAQKRMRRLFDRFEEMRAAALTGKDVRMEMGQVEHELFGLALDVAEMERIITAAVAESKPQKPEKAKVNVTADCRL